MLTSPPSRRESFIFYSSRTAFDISHCLATQSEVEMKRLMLVTAASIAMLSAVYAQGGGGGGGGGGGAESAGGSGISPNSPAPGAAGPFNTQIGSGRSTSNGGENPADVMRTEPPGSENQQR